ncbi:MAG TPA: MarR family transcriptional regulator, partial [Acidimicrobiia bacterium]
SRQEDRVHGITGARMAVLDRLVTTGSLQLTELARAEAVSPATMARIVDALEDGKLVLRVRSAPDGRVVRIVPTTLGATLVTSARHRRLRWLESFIDGLDDGERDVIEQALDIMAGAADWESP